MRFDIARQRLSHLPTPLPPPRADIEAHVLRRGDVPETVRRSLAGPVREAAALVLIYPDAAGEAHIVLMVRPDDDHAHAGQVALPGGKREDGDSFPEGTALREAGEEIGLDATAAGVTVLGRLDVVDVRVTGFLMVPIVAVAEHQPHFVADPREVAALLTVPLRHFLPDAPVELVEEDRDGWRLRYGAYPVQGYRVWGATARALGQLGAVLGIESSESREPEWRRPLSADDQGSPGLGS
jgi:8-oxo-dGTP pyrophosphatase MutT (NUDIX family)